MTRLNHFNWAEFICDLDKLGYRDERLVHKILNSKYLQSFSWYNDENIEKLKEILHRCDTTTHNFLEEESDSECLENDDEMTAERAAAEIRTESPLFKDLSNMFGANKIWSNARITGNLKIPYVLKMDIQSGEFLPITDVPTSSQYIQNNELL